MYNDDEIREDNDDFDMNGEDIPEIGGEEFEAEEEDSYDPDDRYH